MKKNPGIFRSFRFLSFFGVFTLILGLTVYFTSKHTDFIQHAAAANSVEYGFNTHFTTDGYPNYANLTPEFFNKTVDDLVAHNQQWIRFDILAGEVSSWPNSSNMLIMNEANLEKYDTAISYAKSKGLKIFLVTIPPFQLSAGSPSDANYLEANNIYYQGLATRWKGEISVWQIYNEADTHNFNQGTTTLPDLSSTYLNNLKQRFDLARNAIKSIDPNVQITTNVTGYPIQQSTFDSWNTFFDVIAPSLDVLSLDVYPQNADQIALLKNAVIGVESRYSKPVIISETGFPTGNGSFTEQQQADLTAQTINALRQALPMAILYYEYSDTSDYDPTQASFGIVKVDGTHKSSYDSIMASMANPTGLLRVTTNPAVGVTMNVTSLDTGQTVLTKDWGIDWENLPIGNYKISFSNPNNLTVNGNPIILPDNPIVSIFKDQTTTVTVDPTTGIVSIIPAPTDVPTGLLRVETTPASNVNIAITSLGTGQVVLNKDWGIDWESLPIGNYKISYSTNGDFLLSDGTPPKLPQDNYLTIFGNQTTTITADMQSGTQTIIPTPEGIPPLPTQAPPTPTPTPVPATGLLRVETTPPTNTTITVYKSSDGSMVLQKNWSVDWEELPAGNYYATFSEPSGTTAPAPTQFEINDNNRTTEIIANFSNGTTSITYH